MQLKRNEDITRNNLLIKLFQLSVKETFAAHLKNKLNRQMRFSLPSIKCSAAHPSFRLLPSTVSLSDLIEIMLNDLITAARQKSDVEKSLRTLD